MILLCVYVMMVLEKNGFIVAGSFSKKTTYLTIDSSGVHGNNGYRTAEEDLLWSGNGYKKAFAVKMAFSALFDTSELETKRAALQLETAVVAEMIQKCVEENARYALDQTEYQQQYDGLVEQYDKAKTRFEEVTEQVLTTKARGKIMENLIADLRKQKRLITEFDERLWCSLLDFATVYTADDVRFAFKKRLGNTSIADETIPR